MSPITVQGLSEEAESEHVAFTEFMLAYRKDIDLMYCFFEGKEDPRYYSIRIKISTERDYIPFICNGRDKVIKTYKLIKNKKEYINATALFFIDMDYLERITHDGIYCLPYYSVENSYSHISCIEAILLHEFNIKSYDKDFKKAVELFIQLRSKFHDQLLIFNSWLACQSEIRQRNGQSNRLFIDETIKHFFTSIVKDDLKSLADFSSLKNKQQIENLFPNAPVIKDHHLCSKIKQLRRLPHEFYFRGKFELKFTITFLKKLQNEIGKKKQTLFSKKYSCNLKIDDASAISALSQYAFTPSCLTDYLKKFKTM